MLVEDTKHNRLIQWLPRTPKRLAKTILALLGKTSPDRIVWSISGVPGGPPSIDYDVRELVHRYRGIYVGDASKPRVALTFDAGYSLEVPALLRTLNKHGVSATFFLTGKWVERNAPVFEDIVKAGHLIGNHSYSHPDLTTIALEQVANELHSTDQLILRHGGGRPAFFRPPFGHFSEHVLRKVLAIGYRTVFWSICMRDWEPMDQAQLIHGVIDYLHSGAIVLLHVTSDGVRALDTTIPHIKATGYELVTLDQLVEV